jgi:hypothetical protein
LGLAPIAGLLVATGTTALSIAIVVAITGGFALDISVLHLSAHQVVQPLVIAAAAYALAACSGMRRVLDTAAAICARVDQHALAIALTLAATTAGIGVAFGTYAVSGADAGGYIGQADLLARGEISFHEPLVQRVAWPDAAWTFAPLGFRPGRQLPEIVPTYPPGLPIAMLFASTIAGDVGPFLVAPLLGALCVLATFLLGARLHSRLAGLIAAGFMATSPVWLFQIVQPMSDVPATALWTLALLAATSRRDDGHVPLSGAIVSGLSATFAVLMRPNLVPVLVPVVLLLIARPDEPFTTSRLRSRAKPVLAFGAIVALGAAALAAVQWRLYGNPLASGHGAFSELFAFSNVGANVRDYFVRLLRGETPALIVAAVAAALLATTRRALVPPPPIAAPVRLLAIASGAVLICYLPYGVFPDWSYLRFLLPAFPAAFIAIGALVANASLRIPIALRGTALVLTLVTCCSANIMIARREGVFDLRVYEARYRTAGRYLDAVLPRDAVIVTSQESASAHYYTRLPVLRWDLLPGDLDDAIRTLRGVGRRPVLLVEDWEEPILRARFRASSLVALDWRSRALFGTTTRVRYLDPLDRDETASAGEGTRSAQTDRLP